ncbi:SRPBCC family protein [Candidatus Enterococcus ferrettii]|uniref:Polyketide cyclase / dehydrase and lipid transport n=1 Tax=Candidatus Enterococcus ferrettii TaxID=2815324 RepID=A0ABV0EQ72_9ENTE|nr:SRPBCC family protein [Enterococcus sp. 665A]MBO1341305.1 SRPBCC family protein [Enterococcus sp. 665A]
MTVSTIEAIIHAKIEDVWQLVTQLENSEWRSDIDRIDIIKEGKSFIEYTPTGYPTHFAVTKFQPPNFYSFTMNNDNMKGTWQGVMIAKGNCTQLKFTEEVYAKKIFLRPFVKFYLAKQQKQYVQDLKKYLEK